ncbi:MAG: serine/threonine protein kinase [Myxococcales bacterium]|nr:serine/threonine protein kinase [Myxococcales bacterium]
MTDAATAETLDRYELIAPLARGGMGSVHLARLSGVGGFQRLFAIKRMHPHLADEVEFVSMLLDEARIAARLHHPNAVPIVDVCQSPEGPYLVMDYIDGVTLSKVLTGTPEAAWHERVSVALRVLCDALAGLHAAHSLTDDEGQAMGLVHRDVSPQNILIGTDGVGRITDFGIALAASRIAASRPGMIKGKPSYMSPEQVGAGVVDRRVDVFAVGIIAWEALTHARLFHADTEMGALMQVISAPIEAPSARVPMVPQALDAVCLRALERDLAARFDSARSLGEALEKAAADAGMLATAHGVADFLKKHFAAELATRRAVIRDHVRARGEASLSPGRDLESGGRIASGVLPGLPERSGPESERSIPAIEVQSTPSPVPAPERLAPPLPSPARGPWRFGAALAGLMGLLGLGLALRPTPAPTPTPTPVVVPPAPSPAPPAPVRAPEVVVPAPTPAAPLLGLSDAAVGQDARAATPMAAPSRPVATPTRRPRPTPAEEPALENNPYLHR